MKTVIPAAIAFSLVAGIAQAQTTGATTTTNGVGSSSSATNGTTPNAHSSTTGRMNAAGQAPASTAGNPSTADTGTRTGTLGSPAVGTPNDNNHTGSTNNAVNTRPQINPGAPHPGANSFTEGEARSRIQDNGFSQVTGLKKDDQGIWRGQAMKNGKQTNVALDYQGNIVAQ